MVEMLLAQRINQAAGGAVIAPWEVMDLPEAYLDAAEALTVGMVGYGQARRRVDEIKARWRNSHPHGGNRR